MSNHPPTCPCARIRPTDWLWAPLRFLVSAPARRSLDRRLHAGTVIPEDAFGICVAGTADPAGDDFLVDQLRALNLSAVRLDYALPAAPEHTPRLLDRLLREGFRICLHPVADDTPPGAAPRIAWREALDRLLDRVGSRLDLLEFGATINRRKWRGGSMADLLTDYQAVHQMAAARGMALAAPNVTDFEPIYNLVLLDTLRRAGRLPRFHSDNLFVERAGEPEQFDHKILGRGIASLLRFDLIRKARVLAAAGRWAGVPETLCSHTAWSLRRIARFNGAIEAKQADYLSRYAILAAASGALRRMYWGPLIGQREGLIDDGTDIYPPVLPHVTRYTMVPGRIADFRRRPAFAAYQTVIAQMRGARLTDPPAAGAGLTIIAAVRSDGDWLHIAWTRDGRRALTADLYPPEVLARAAVTDRDGNRLATPPDTISESPTYWRWPAACIPAVRPAAAPVPGLRFENDAAGRRYRHLLTERWTGTVAGPADAPPPDAPIDPNTWAPPNPDAVLRDARNRVWIQNLAWRPETDTIIKQFGVPRGVKRLLQCLKPTRARRSWNGAIELRRRGLPTPAPIALMEASRQTTAQPSYYLCEALPTRQSVRTFFTAYHDGAPVHEGIEQAGFFRQCAAFIADMHRKGVFFRDLSAGNILVTPADPSPAMAAFALIDTARARFFPYPLDRRRRLCDLMRICHPLDPARRRAFLEAYLSAAGIRYRGWMALPFLYYNAKHRLKKRLRRHRAAG